MALAFFVSGPEGVARADGLPDAPPAQDEAAAAAVIPAPAPVWHCVPLPWPAQAWHAGIAMLVVGNLLQFAGVSMLIPALFHHSDDGRFPAGKLAAAAGVLVGVGNVVEGVGWPFLIKGNIERDRLRREADDDLSP